MAMALPSRSCVQENTAGKMTLSEQMCGAVLCSHRDSLHSAHINLSGSDQSLESEAIVEFPKGISMIQVCSCTANYSPCPYYGSPLFEGNCTALER